MSEAKKKKKPARVQVEKSVLDDMALNDKQSQVGNVFNIWYYNFGNKDRKQSKSPFKVNVKQDTGYTQADKLKTNQYICLYFARGCCFKGKDCEYLHRIPKPQKDSFPVTVDCFGRDKFSDYREDMGGVGNILKPNKTLYIARVPTEVSGRSVEDIVIRNFQEFGRLEKIKVIYNKACAFVTFENEWNAQFAKEAMAHQTLVEDGDILSVRWASEDPSAMAKKISDLEIQREAIKVLKRSLEDSNDSGSTTNNGGHVNKKVETKNRTNGTSIFKVQNENKPHDVAKSAMPVKKLKSEPLQSGVMLHYDSSSDDDNND